MSIAVIEARACKNHLLARLSDEHFQVILPLLQMVETNLQDVLLQQGEKIEHIYFPCNCIQSCIVLLEDGSSVEVGTIGNEGFTGVEVLLDAPFATETVVCQIAGMSLRMRVEALRNVLSDVPDLLPLLQRSGQAYLTQVSQPVACNRMHSVDLRFARWLLITHDRVQGDEFSITQDFLAGMLGVHRPSISVVAGLFQQAGMIKYSRGRMQILVRVRLEEASCECYGVVREKFKRLIGEVAVDRHHRF